MKRMMLIGLAAIVILILVCCVRLSAASPSDQCSAPVLISSARPEPVEYSPGRLVEGYVTLEIKVGTDGSVKTAKVLYRTSERAIGSAIRAVEQWKFTPAIMNDKVVESVVVYALPFGQNLSIFADEKYPVRFDCPSNNENDQPCQVTYVETR